MKKVIIALVVCCLVCSCSTLSDYKEGTLYSTSVYNGHYISLERPIRVLTPSVFPGKYIEEVLYMQADGTLLKISSSDLYRVHDWSDDSDVYVINNVMYDESFDVVKSNIEYMPGYYIKDCETENVEYF